MTRGCIINRGSKQYRKPKDKNKLAFGIDGDMYIIPSDFEQDFKTGYNEYVVRGIYHWTTSRSVVYLKGHEVIEDIISTCGHETTHHCLKEIQQDPTYEINMDDEQEHNIIREIAWANETLALEFEIARNQACRDVLENE